MYSFPSQLGIVCCVFTSIPTDVFFGGEDGIEDYHNNTTKIFAPLIDIIIDVKSGSKALSSIANCKPNGFWIKFLQHILRLRLHHVHCSY